MISGCPKENEPKRSLKMCRNCTDFYVCAVGGGSLLRTTLQFFSPTSEATTTE